MLDPEREYTTQGGVAWTQNGSIAGCAHCRQGGRGVARWRGSLEERWDSQGWRGPRPRSTRNTGSGRAEERRVRPRWSAPQATLPVDRSALICQTIPPTAAAVGWFA